jgi:hypothetical protein
MAAYNHGSPLPNGVPDAFLAQVVFDSTARTGLKTAAGQAQED